MINTPSTEEAKRLIKKAEKPIVIMAQNDDFNRKILEYGNFDILLSPEIGMRKNKVRQTDSGLNHVLAAIATKNNVAMGTDLQELKTLEPKAKAERLARIMQNIKICRKAKTKIAAKAKRFVETREILQSLGASSQQAAGAIVF